MDTQTTEHNAIVVVEARPLQTAPVVEDRSGARSDGQLVSLWLSSKRNEHTRRAYSNDVAGFMAHLSARGASLRSASVADLQDWIDTLSGATSTQARRIAAVRSLLTFGQKTGYLAFNVGAAVEAPKVPNDLAERILDESEVHAILRAGKGRDAALVRFLYGSGARVSEACGLQWKHIHPTDGGGAVVTLHGKGGKTRHIPLSVGVVEALETQRPDDCAGEGFVFATRSGRSLHPANVTKTVRRLAKAAGIDKPVSPHWFRHAHASHALDRNAPVHLVQATLGHASVSTTGRYLHARPDDGSSLYLSV